MNDVCLKLAEGICFENYGDAVYLRSIPARKDYLFNEIVYDMLSCLRGGALTGAELCGKLMEVYDIEDAEAFRADIFSFIDMLVQEGILLNVNVEAGPQPSVNQQLQQICTQRHILQSVCLELTYRCNERCIHCYADDQEYGDELTLDEYKNLLTRLRAMGCINLLLTGGEVCKRGDFIEIARHATSLGMLVDIFSNGIGISDSMFDAIKALRPNSLSFSLYAGTAGAHDAVTRVKGSFDRTLRAIMMTKCAGIDTYIKTVVMRENFDHYEDLLKLGRRLDIPVTPGFAILDTHSGCSGAQHRLARMQDYQHAMELTQRYFPKDLQDPVRDPDGPVCNAGRCSLSINPYGEVYPCLSMHIPLGSIREKPIEDIWANAAPLERLHSLRFCEVCTRAKECPHLNHCEICLGHVGYLGRLEDVSIPSENCYCAEASANIFRQLKDSASETTP